MRIPSARVSAIGAGIGVVAAVAVAAGALAGASDRGASRLGADEVRRVPFDTVVDLSDDAKLAGFADHVFVGEVLARQGQRGGSLPWTRWRVRVRVTYKGELPTEITVRQPGGYGTGHAGARLVLTGRDRLLRAGRTYLFATTDDPRHQRQNLIPYYGDRAVVVDGGGDGPVFRTAGGVDLHEHWQRAVADQVPYRPGRPAPARAGR